MTIRLDCNRCRREGLMHPHLLRAVDVGKFSTNDDLRRIHPLFVPSASRRANQVSAFPRRPVPEAASLICPCNGCSIGW